MTIVLWLVMLGVVFVACRWSGAMLDQHYNDRLEVAAVLVVALCVLGPLLLGSARDDANVLALQASLALTVGGGLLTGGRRTPR
jgi:hypothetical protein